jgi:hypothetical protein
MELTPAQRYYQAHKEQRREYGRNYYAQNRDAILTKIHARKATRDPGIATPIEEAPVVEEPVMHIADPIAEYKRRGPPHLRVKRSEGAVIEFK